MALQPWDRIAWPDEYLQLMYRDWGACYTQKLQLDVASKYYNKSLELRNDDPNALQQRGRCNMILAHTEDALEDAIMAGQYRDHDVKIDLLKCRALYELNRFEDTKVEMHDDTRKYIGVKVDAFVKGITVLDENFKDSLGVSFGPFIMKAEKYFGAVLEGIERRQHVETRPLWKILREAGKCDVLSILEKEEELLSPREIARRERAYRLFNQIYLTTSWKDVLFMKGMRKDPTLLWPPSKVSAPALKQLTEIKYETVKKFEKMLHARSPLYNEMMVKFGNKKMWEKNRENHLNRVQYQTRRNMITILRTIRKLRAGKHIEKLSKYIEEAMGDYVVLKTYRVMPWKFEFLNDVYNTLALAYADQYVNPPTIPEMMPEKNRIQAMLRLPTEHKEKPAFIFGDKSTYQEPDAIDYAFIAYKSYLARLERRLIFAKYPIEKCYLHHQIARAHLKQSHYDECCSAARKAIEEVKNFNSHLWAFLSAMLIVKANAMVYKIEQVHEALEDAYTRALHLCSPELLSFVKTCQEFNEADIMTRKRTRSTDTRKRKMSLSVTSAINSSGSNATFFLSHYGGDTSSEEEEEMRAGE